MRINTYNVTAFTKKKIIPTKRVCLRIKEAREKANVSLDAVSAYTKIDKKYLSALEECRFDDLPRALVYRKNFIKQYLKAIGLNPKPFIKQFIMEETESSEDELFHPQRTIEKYHFHNVPSFFKYTVVSIVILAFLFYLGLQVKHILEPPQLTVFSPENGLVTSQTPTTIKGQTDPEVQITINGKEVVNNEKGEFEEHIDLALGINNISISATKKHGKTTTEVRYVILKETERISFQGLNPIVKIP